ncbi:hypothetical protein [Roseiflexus castenholzii]|uniref:hypothetical protein n=1 Tax=Roseiflexus castenholzii TaxID=120962 RepID=UPI003C7C1673
MIVRRHINHILADVEAAIPPDGKRDYFRLHRDRFAMLLAAIPPDARPALDLAYLRILLASLCALCASVVQKSKKGGVLRVESEKVSGVKALNIAELVIQSRL